MPNQKMAYFPGHDSNDNVGSKRGKYRTVEDISHMKRFTRFQFDYMHESKDAGAAIFYVANYPFSWLLRVDAQTYRSWGSPSSITGSDILSKQSD